MINGGWAYSPTKGNEREGNGGGGKARRGARNEAGILLFLLT